VFSVRYKLGFYIPEDDVLYIRRRENLTSDNCKGFAPVASWYIDWLRIRRWSD
jgi:hypothetical protein